MMANPNFLSASTSPSLFMERNGPCIANANMPTPSLPSPLNQNASTGPVAILWDMENCAIPNDIQPDDVAGNIRMALRVRPVITGPVTMFSAYGDFNLIPRRVREGCQKTGVKLVDIPNGKKDAADKAILVDMFLFALDNRPPSSIVLISGDVDFSPALHILGQRGYTVILVFPSGKPVSSALCNAGCFVWDWRSVARGEGFLPISEAVFPPRVCTPDLSGYLMGRALNDKPDFQNNDQAIVHRGIAWSSCNSRSLSLPSGLNEVTAGPVSSSYEDNVLWNRPGDLTGLKAQLVKLLELYGGCLSLYHVPSKYQKMFKRPLIVGEYGTSNLLSLMEKVGDVLVIDEQGPNKTVRIRNPKPDPVLPLVSRINKKGKGDQEQNIGANVTAGPVFSSNENDEIARRPGDLKCLKGQLVKLLKLSGGCLSLNCVLSEYHRIFKRPLTAAEYGVSEVVSLMERVGDVLAIDEQGPDKIVCLRNLKPDPVLFPVLGTVEKGNGVQEQNMGANVTAGPVSSGSENDEIARRPGNLKHLKGQLVKLLKLSGGCLSLNCVPSEYHRMFKRPLTVAEYGASKLVGLMERMGNVLAIDEQGPDKIVRLRKLKPDPVLSPVSRTDKKGGGAQEKNMGANVTAGSASSGNQNDGIARSPGDLKHLKVQLVKLLKLSGGCLSLNCVPSEYHRMFKRPLTVGEYGASKLVNLMEMVGDVLAIDKQGPDKIVHLRNLTSDPVLPLVILSRTDKKGKGAQHQNTGANVTAGPVSSSNENDEIARRPGDLKRLKGELVKLLKLSGGCLSLNSVPSEYHRMFKRPLTVREYGASKLVGLMEKVGNVLAIDEQGPDKIVHLRNWKPDPVLPPVILSGADKKGKGAQEQNMGANVAAGPVSSAVTSI